MLSNYCYHHASLECDPFTYHACISVSPIVGPEDIKRLIEYEAASSSCSDQGKPHLPSTKQDVGWKRIGKPSPHSITHLSHLRGSALSAKHSLPEDLYFRLSLCLVRCLHSLSILYQQEHQHWPVLCCSPAPLSRFEHLHSSYRSQR